MKFDQGLQVWVAAADSSKDTSRPVLNMVNVIAVKPFKSSGVEYNGLLVAADGLILAVVPCTLEDGDVPGVVLADRFPAAIKASGGKRAIVASMALGDTAVTLANGVTMPRLPGTTTLGDYAFPDYARIVPDRPYAAGPLQFGINPTLLGRLSKALNAMDGIRITGQPSEPGRKPLIIDSAMNGPDEMKIGHKPIAPYGIIMPMHLAQNKWATTNVANEVAA